MHASWQGLYRYKLAKISPERGFLIALRTLASLLNEAVQWRERARGRRFLGRLNDRMLRDTGLSRSDVERESGKFFWER
jgi:uncharacterized protein YjiS (DUF1127 family)